MIDVRIIIRYPYKILTFLSLFIITFSINAQQSFSIKSLISNQELKNNSSRAFCEDQYGFLWIGYTGGLDRYDGEEIQHYPVDPFTPGSLPNPLIRCILNDSKNRLWIGTQGGLVQFDYSKQNFVKIDINIEASPSPWIEAMEETHENGEPVLWLAVYQTGLVKFYPDKGVSVLFRPDPNDQNSISDSTILDIHYDGKNLWLGTLHAGLNKFDPETGQAVVYKNDPSDQSSINDNYVLQIISDTIDNEHVLWLGTGTGGLVRFNTESERFDYYSLESDNLMSKSSYSILSLVKYQDKLLTGTAGGGLYVFNLQSERFEESSSEQSGDISNIGFIESIYHSPSGLVWVGSQENGIFYFDPQSISFTYISSDTRNKNSLSAKSVNSFAEISPGKVMIATNAGIDLYLSDQNLIIRHENNPELKHLIPAVRINSICKSESNSEIVWIGTFNEGLIKLNLNTKTISRYYNDPNSSESISSNSITIIRETSDAFLWFAGAGEGLNRMDLASGRIKRYYHEKDKDNSLGDNHILSIYEDIEGTLWISTFNGLSKYRSESDDFKTITFNEGKQVPAANLIGSTTQDMNNPDILWVSTAAGLIRLNKKTENFSRLTIQNGLSTNLILGAIPTHDNYLWLCTAKGISRYNTESGYILNFTSTVGVEEEEFNFNAFFEGSDGTIYFGGSNGLTLFHPADFEKSVLRNKIIFTDFYLLNKKLEIQPETILDSSLLVKNNIVLPWSDNAFGIGFVLPDFRKSSKIVFEYKLNGFDQDWISTPVNSRMVSFTNIPPGEYEFQVRAQCQDNQLKSEYSSLSIRILRPFWKTWWAYSLYVIITIGGIAAYIRNKSYQLKKEKARLEKLVNERTEELALLNKNKDRFFSIVAHDIKSPLISLVKFTEMVLKRYNKLSEDEKINSITEISKSLNSSYKYLTNLLNWSRIQIGRFEYNPGKINLKNLIDKQIEYLKINASNKNIRIVSEVRDDIFVNADYEMISIVFSNLISNGIKFTDQGGRVSIQSNIRHDKVSTIVEDNGVGIAAEQIVDIFSIGKITKTRGTENEDGTGLGLILSNELAVKNFGKIYVDSSVGSGSKFTVELPVADEE